jgi:hypothetical protein
MPVQEKIPSELEQLLEQAQTRATEAGLHGLPDGFLDTVAPALTVAAARRFGDGGPSLETLRFRADELEAKRRSAEEEAEHIRTATARPAPTGDFRWRPELSAAAVFGLAGLCLDLFGPERLNAREWAALALAGFLVALNLRAVPREVGRLCARIGQSVRRRTAARSEQRLEQEMARLRAGIFETEDRTSQVAQWIARCQPLVLAEYHMYKDRAAAAAQLES